MTFTKNQYSVYLSITLVLVLLLLQRCKKIDPERVLIVKTGSIINITYNSFSVDATLLDMREEGVNQHGFCWATTPNPTISDNKNLLGSKHSRGNFSADIAGLLPNTTYHVKAYAINLQETAYGDQITFKTALNSIPTLTTTDVVTFTSTSAKVAGNVTADGNATVTDHGVYWGTSQSPEATGTKLQIGSGTGIFSTTLSGLSPNTTYYIKAYATNSQGSAYGNQVSFSTTGTVTDIDGNVYKTISIGSRVWMAENLNTTKYNDGTPLPNIIDKSAFAALTTGAYCDYDNIPANSDTYGRLYNWYAVDKNAASKLESNGGKNVCPTGWHIPTDTEWTALTEYLINNGYGFEGSGSDIAKSMAANSGWDEYGTPGTVGSDQASNNSSGFMALPGGYRTNSGAFFGIGFDGCWWSSTTSSTYAVIRDIDNQSSDVYRAATHKEFGFSVRCVRD